MRAETWPDGEVTGEQSDLMERNRVENHSAGSPALSVASAKSPLCLQ